MTNTSKYSEAGVRRRSFKIGVLQNYAIFTGKQLCWSLFLIKNLIKTGVFLWILGNFYELFHGTPLAAASKYYSFKKIDQAIKKLENQNKRMKQYVLLAEDLSLS